MKFGFEFDLHEFVEFSNKLQDTYELETALMTATQNVARVLHKHLLINTPVDTGNLRKMWSAGNNLYFTVENKNGGYEVTFINKAVNKRNVSEKYPNGFEYGIAVNDGHKTPDGTGWVMGRFFVEKSIVQVRDSKQLESIVFKELQTWWKGCF